MPLPSARPPPPATQTIGVSQAWREALAADQAITQTGVDLSAFDPFEQGPLHAANMGDHRLDGLGSEVYYVRPPSAMLTTAMLYMCETLTNRRWSRSPSSCSA